MRTDEISTSRRLDVDRWHDRGVGKCRVGAQVRPLCVGALTSYVAAVGLKLETQACSSHGGLVLDRTQVE